MHQFPMQLSIFRAIQLRITMPIYVYEVVRDDNQDGETFEILQGLNDPPLTQHPESGKTVRRCLSVPSITGTWSDSKNKSRLSDKNLSDKGFTKYVKAGDGMYEKRAGKGPDVISANELKRRQSGA